MEGAPAGRDAPLILCLHGMGMDEHIFAGLLRGLFDLPYAFLLPRAPRWVPLPGRPDPGASWYPYDGNQRRFRRALERAEAFVLGVLHRVEARAELAPRERILLGFSQGGYCAAYVALRHPELFAGMVLSGARVKTEFLAEEIPRAAARGFRALLCHGSRDTAVLPEAAERSRRALEDAGIETERHLFEAGHSLGGEQIRTIRAWLLGRFPPSRAPSGASRAKKG